MSDNNKIETTLWKTADKLRNKMYAAEYKNIDFKDAVDDIRSLTGLLNKDGDVGVFVTSGYFTSEAERCARESHRHIKLLDIDSFIGLWQELYLKLSDEDKNMLPLHPIYFLGSNE